MIPVANSRAVSAVTLLIDESDTLEKDGQYAQSLDVAERAVRAAGLLDDPVLLSSALRREIAALRILSEHAAVITSCLRIIAMAQDPALSDKIDGSTFSFNVCHAFISLSVSARLSSRSTQKEQLDFLNEADRWMAETGHTRWRCAVLNERAEVYLEFGDVDRAVELSRQALTEYTPGTPGLSRNAFHVSLGRSLIDAGRDDEARRQFQTVVDSSNPGAFDGMNAHRGLARCAARAGDPEACDRHLDMVLKSAERHSRSALLSNLLKCGIILADDMRHDAALAMFDRVVELESGYSNVDEWRGHVLARKGQLKEAIDVLGHALEANPSSSWAMERAAVLMRRLGRNDEALAMFDRLIGIKPTGSSFSGRGETHRVMGNLDEAIADFDRAFELDPDLSWAAKQASLLRRTSRGQ